MNRSFWLLVASVFVLVRGASATEIVDGVAAIVNDRVITYSEVKNYVQPVVAQLRRSYAGTELIEKARSAQMDALNTLIERALIIQEFNEKGFSIPETVIEGQVNDIIAGDFGGNRGAFIKTLQAENMTLLQYRDQVRDRIIVQAMRNRKAQQQVVASPFKIENYYQENIGQFKVDDKIKLRMIFVKRGQPEVVPAETPTQEPVSEKSPTNVGKEPDTEITQEITGSAATAESDEARVAEVKQPAAVTVDPRRRLAQEIVDKLDAGDSFDSLARIYSEGRQAREGGDWGWVRRDELRKELNEVAFTLKPGEHSPLIETAEGYYILYVEDVKPAHTRSLGEVRDEIEKALLQQQRARMQDEWIKELRAKAYIRLF